MPPMPPSGRTTAPKLMPDRVILILKEAAAPLRPKQMAESYIARGWPVPAKWECLYNCAELCQLFGEKKDAVIIKTEAGYSLATH